MARRSAKLLYMAMKIWRSSPTSEVVQEKITVIFGGMQARLIREQLQRGVADDKLGNNLGTALATITDDVAAAKDTVGDSCDANEQAKQREAPHSIGRGKRKAYSPLVDIVIRYN